MSNEDDKRDRQQSPASDPFGHLIPGPDPRTPEERAEAQRKENARRKGRGRKDWWKKYPPTDLR